MVAAAEVAAVGLLQLMEEPNVIVGGPRGLRRSVEANRSRLQQMRESLASLGAREARAR